MGKGQKKESAYSLFVREFRKKVGCSYQEAYELAAAEWEKMSAQAKQRFVDEANRLKNKSQAVSTGMLAQKDEEEKKHAMKEAITSTINLAHERIFEHKFFVIHINPFFYMTTEKKYYPAEIGVAHFTLQDGLQLTEETTMRGEIELKPLVYHAYCYPGVKPTGYAADVKLCNHKLPYPDKDDEHQMETSTEEEIFETIISLLSQGLLHNQPLPPIYTLKKIKPMIEDIIASWLKKFSYDENYIKVYDLEELFYQLNAASTKIRSEKCKKDNVQARLDVVNGNPHAELLLSKDYFDFTPGIACEYHELSDVMNLCSKSYVIRWIYLICSFCCDPANMIAIQHMPKDAQLKQVASGTSYR